jgi:ferric-dicitrate binding protein FerR (iron transport regulator)
MMAEHDDSDIARVLRATGGRADPSEDMKQSVYAAVHAEWRSVIAERKQRRTRRLWLAAAASITVIAVSLILGRALFFSEPALFADVNRSVGSVQIRDERSESGRDLAATRTLHVGERISTGPDGRLALALPDGVSLRLDHDTNVAFVGADRIDVSSGAVYIDSGTSTPRPGRLHVGTPTGVVRHIGTQYEARIVNGATRIRVREGRVDVEAAQGTRRTLRVGDQIVISRSGIEERGSIAPDSDEWNWVASTAPEFDINGRPVHEFLAWAGRESGLRVVFATPESAAEARRAVLSGSVAGLSPAEAVAAVLPTTSLRSTERDGQLIIEMAAAPGP